MHWDGRLCGKTVSGECGPGLDQSGNDCLTGSKGEPQCPADSQLLEDVCVKEPTCQSGYDFVDGLCTQRESPICKEDFRFDSSRGICYFKDVPECETGTVLRDGVCILPNVQAKCEPGFILDSKCCVLARVPYCNEGTFDGEACCLKDLPPICKTSQSPDASLDAFGRCSVLPNCEKDTKFKNGACLMERQPFCESGALYNAQSTTCECEQKFHCKDGFTLINGKCEFEVLVPTCKDDEELKNGNCCKRPKCPPGTTYIPGTNTCGAPPRCEDYQSLKDGNCIEEEVPKCGEERGFKWDGTGSSSLCVKLTPPTSCNKPTVYNKETKFCFVFSASVLDCGPENTYDQRVKRFNDTLQLLGLNRLNHTISELSSLQQISQWANQGNSDRTIQPVKIIADSEKAKDSIPAESKVEQTEVEDLPSEDSRSAGFTSGSESHDGEPEVVSKSEEDMGGEEELDIEDTDDEW
ncbi:uncharacterized protein N7483_012483 [Penicillium malachiteum]|uniref:uncharacterized protein n=1 Tax=Penicillium malachiteum TaxID=1324776 RepID=UPI0025497A5C|nr:uncharacterized protein N7483_012483 [Penicillium malachiteum]KAJ5715302.1 hypothetical protein N7483_012483 [Penicillium malachiteum]